MILIASASDMAGRRSNGLRGRRARRIRRTASHLLTPLLAGLAAAMSGLVVDQVASRVNRDCYAMLGVSLSPAALHQAARTAVLLAAVTALTVVFCLAAAVVLTMVRPG